jgi:mono/diheme cytochrome c family protein
VPVTVVGTLPQAAQAPITPAFKLKGDPVAGKKIFLQAGCKGCHTLADAGATGRVGPNLDAAKPSRELVINRVTNGQGAMPAFASKLSPQQIGQVADYVATRAGA